MNLPKLNGIDHIHLYVANKQRAADWYNAVLGFNVVESLKLWNKENGPLTIEDELGIIHLALFTRKEQQPSTAIAFKATGEEFLNWKKHLTEQKLTLRIANHQVAWSLYFKDPDNNMHEITTYDYQMVANQIENEITRPIL